MRVIDLDNGKKLILQYFTYYDVYTARTKKVNTKKHTNVYVWVVDKRINDYIFLIKINVI